MAETGYQQKDLCRVQTNIERTAELFNAFERGDQEEIRRLCSPRLEATQNRQSRLTLDQLIDFTLAVQGAVDDFRYVDAVRTETPRGAVEEHVVAVTLADGTELRIAACVVCEIEEGLFVSLRETVDGAAAVPLLAALA